MAKNYTHLSLGMHIVSLTDLDPADEIYTFDDEDCILFQWLDISSPNDSINRLPVASPVRLLAGATVSLFPLEGGEAVATVTIPVTHKMAEKEGGKYFLRKNIPSD